MCLDASDQELLIFKFFHVFAAKRTHLPIKFEPTGGFNLKSSYFYSVNYGYIYPLIKLEPTEKFN